MHALREDENPVLRSEDVGEDGSESEVVDVEFFETESSEAVNAEDLFG